MEDTLFEKSNVFNISINQVSAFQVEEFDFIY